MEVILWATLIFFLRVVNATLGTVRMLLMIRGQKLLSVLTGILETLSYVVAIGKVIQNLNNPWNILGYCGGFATGTLIGMALEERLALGFAVVRIVSTHKGREIADAVRKEGYGATEMRGKGRSNMVNIINVVVKRKDAPSVLAIATEIDEKAFVTVEEPKSIYRGYLPIAR